MCWWKPCIVSRVEETGEHSWAWFVDFTCKKVKRHRNLYLYVYTKHTGRYTHINAFCAVWRFTRAQQSARIPLVLFPFHYYNRNNGKQFEQTIIEWPMGLVVFSNARLCETFCPRLICHRIPFAWLRAPKHDCCAVTPVFPIFQSSRKYNLKLRLARRAVWETHS